MTATGSRAAGLLRRPEFASLIGAVAIFILFLVVAPSFRSMDAVATVLYTSSTLGIVALAVGLLMIGDEFDLSTGVAVTTTALAATMIAYNFHLQTWVGSLLALVIALAIGFFNGWMVTRTGIPSFLITLATFLMLQGLNLAVTKLVNDQVATPVISDMQGYEFCRRLFAGSLTVFGVTIQVTVFWWILFVAVASWVLFKTRFGNWIFAVGGDKDAARAVGVPVDRVKIILFMTVAASCWFVGQHNLYQFDSIQAGQGVGNEFLYIIAAVVGGCAMTGGKGTAVGTAIGALIFGMTNQGIVYAGWNPDWFKFFLGGVLLLAVLANNSFSKYSEARQ
ncbi:MAG: ABC transporter permease [Corynebacterium sp.]|jgi:simple sugar transport system permease protein|uniref:ABC transporter permease n=1 Tax=unclassified Corynebacterium TaxID=2624378 RepID=UPI0009FA4D19|nr:ABC transporter permease [Corynebacterium sp. CNJ-954]